MQESGPVKRRLTAILAADAVGYSAGMAENEERTLRTLAGHRRLIDSLIADHGGRIVGTAGDSVLAEFGSSVEAVRCAVEIQEALATRNDSLPEPERLHFRIGINLGEVIVDGADILGDGVNVASRLEGIADPGGICIASSVFDQISGKLNLGFEDIGERSLKNIGRRVRAYRVGRPGAPRQQPARTGFRRVLVVALARTAAIVAIALVVFYVVGPGLHRDTPQPTPVEQPAQRSTETSAPQPTVPQPAAVAPPAPAAPLSRAQAQPGTEIPPAPPQIAQVERMSTEAPSSFASPGLTATMNYTTGMVQGRCQRPDGTLGPFVRGRAQVVDGEIVIAVGEPGQPGQVDLRGRPEADGTLVLSGFIVPGAGRGRGTRVPARYEGRLADGRGMLTGNQGIQRCTLGLQLK